MVYLLHNAQLSSIIYSVLLEFDTVCANFENDIKIKEYKSSEIKKYCSRLKEIIQDENYIDNKSLLVESTEIIENIYRIKNTMFTAAQIDKLMKGGITDGE